MIARNPDPASRLPYLLHLPVAGGMVFRAAGTWPRVSGLYCHPVSPAEWPEDPDVVERVRLRSCVRRGAAIDIVADRARENRSQLVFTTARGRDAVFWQSPRTRKQARQKVRLPTGRAAGVADLQIVVDSRERYAYRFAGRPVAPVVRALPCGDYGVTAHGRLVAAVERKSLPDLAGSVMSGRLRFSLGDLAALPRAAVVVEERYSRIFRQNQVSPASLADSLAELQVRWPDVPVIFCESRPLAEDWVYRYLAAAHLWAHQEPAAAERLALPLGDLEEAPAAPAPSTAEVRAWARDVGLPVPDRGRLRPEIWAAWRAACAPDHPDTDGSGP